MKIILDNRATSKGRKRILEHNEALLSLVEQEADGHRRGLLRTLTGLLFPAESILVLFPPRTCFALAVAALELMDRRQEDIALLKWIPEGGKSALLLINLPDLSSSAPSLDLLACSRDRKFRLMTYLPLTALRNRGGVFGLSAAGQDGAREALIVLESEGGGDNEQIVRETLAAAIQVCRDASPLASRLGRLATVPFPKQCLELLDWLRTGAFIPYAYRLWTQSGLGVRTECVDERLGCAALAHSCLAPSSDVTVLSPL